MNTIESFLFALRGFIQALSAVLTEFLNRIAEAFSVFGL